MIFRCWYPEWSDEDEASNVEADTDTAAAIAHGKPILLDEGQDAVDVRVRDAKGRTTDFVVKMIVTTTYDAKRKR